MDGKRAEEIARVTAELAARLEELEAVVMALSAGLAAEENGREEGEPVGS